MGTIRHFGAVALALIALASYPNASAETPPPTTAGDVRVRINELMAKNDGTLRDYLDRTPDWIELQVVGAPGDSERVVNLDGWALTDDPTHADVWRFPDADIALGEGGHIVVFASGDGNGTERIARPDAPLYASFKLTDAGEYLAVLGPDGKVADEIARYPAQFEDVSWGRDGGDPTRLGYMLTPTPGRSNAALISQPKPLITRATKTVAPPLRIDQDLNVSACVAVLAPAGVPAPEPEVVLRYRVNYDGEYAVRMARRQGNNNTSLGEGGEGGRCEGAAGFAEYAATVDRMAFSGPAGARDGDMLRWFVEASVGPALARSPSLEVSDPTDAGRVPEYYGTAVVDGVGGGGEGEGGVDALHWFIPPDAAWEVETDAEAEARSSVYFQGRFYDNIKVRQRGITALLWPKKKFKFDFKGPVFDVTFAGSAPGRLSMEEINLQSHWEEPGEDSYMRENVATDFFRDAGLPTYATLHVELRQNGMFYGLYSIVEQIDARFLSRIGYNPHGHLYKAFSGTTSNLNNKVPEHLMRMVYRRGNRVDDDDDWSDLRGLTESLAGENGAYADVEHYLYHHMNLPELINELAVQAAILNQDRCTKNFYVYYDPSLEEWSRFAWDLEAVMAISNGLHGQPAEDYCMLVCPQFNSPLYCDSDHPQDPLPKPGANFVRQANVAPGLETPELNYNHLTDALLDTPSIRAMYLRRLQTLVDAFIEADYLPNAVRGYGAKLGTVAAKDDAKWGTGALAMGVKQLLTEQLPQRREQLTSTYAAGGAEPLLPKPQNASITLDVRKAYIPLEEEFRAAIEIRNPHDAAVDVSGWLLTNGENATAVRGMKFSPRFCDDAPPEHGEATCAEVVAWGLCGGKTRKEGVCRRSCDECRIRKGPMRFAFAPGTVVPGKSSIYVTDDTLAYKRNLRKYGMFQFVVGPIDGAFTKEAGLSLFDANDRKAAITLTKFS